MTPDIGLNRAAVLEGLGAMVPPRVMTNDMLARRLDTSDDWIYSRTGIRQRHLVDAGTATSQLAIAAATDAIKSANGSAGRIDMVVLATTTPDYQCPATAPFVATALGLTGVPAFDISAVCSGFVYALGVAQAAVVSGLAERVLVIGAEAFTTIIDADDRSTAALFGDGAGAAVLRAGTAAESGAIRAVDLGSDGDLWDLIMVPGGGSRQRATGQPPEPGHEFLTMRGREVFTHAVLRMTSSARTVLDRTGWRTDDVDWFVGHQANVRILHAVADRLRVPRERAVVNLDRVGNTAAASIPLAMADAMRADTFSPGDKILITAFGGGATWGSAALTWPAIDVA